MNAKAEFLVEVGDKKIIYAKIDFGKKLELKEGYTQKEYDAFLNSLDQEYDEGYGNQELYGIILYTNNVWSTRSEYDGSEWWSTHKCPTVNDINKYY